MLLDRRQRGWIIFTFAAAGLAVAGRLCAPDDTTGGSQVGLWFALAGGVCLVLVALLAVVRRLPGCVWLGPRQTWLRIHLWFGTLGGVLIVCHTGWHLGGPFEWVLYGLFLLTLATGYLGWAVQHFLPGRLTGDVACEVPYDQIPHLVDELVRRADLLAKKIQAATLPEPTLAALNRFHEELVRPFLVRAQSWPAGLASAGKVDEVFDKVLARVGADPVAGELAELRTYCQERRALASQERGMFWLHAWLYVHVPLSVAMLVLMLVHAGMTLYY